MSYKSVFAYSTAVALLLGGGAYVGSPYLAANNLKNAAISGDADQIEEKVDFPAVRASMKSQISAVLTQKVYTDPGMRNNPFAGLAMMMIPNVVNQTVDAYITADGLSALVRGAKPGNAKTAPSSEKPDIKYTYEWVNTDRFRVKTFNTKIQKAGPALIFERRGFASWKLVKVDIASFLDE